MVTGRRPMRPDEVALGAGTMRQLRTRIGGWVTLSSSAGPRQMKVVGEAVFPSFGRGSFTPTDLGEGAVTTAGVVAKPPAGANAYNFVLLRFSKQARRGGALAVAQVAHQSGCPADQCIMTTERLLPTDVQSYNRVSMTPVYLAGLLAIFGAAMVGHALVTSVRRRRRDLALLKTLGLTTRQVAAAVAWQASTFALLGAVFGVPAGWALGRWLWSLFASEIGIPGTFVLPLQVFLVVAGRGRSGERSSPLCLAVRRPGRGLPSSSGRSDRWASSDGAGKPTCVSTDEFRRRPASEVSGRRFGVVGDERTIFLAAAKGGRQRDRADQPSARRSQLSRG